MSRGISLFIQFLAVFFCCVSVSIAGERIDRFRGESLKYHVTWENIVNAGIGTLSFEEQAGKVVISSTATSAEWLEMIGITVRDVVTSVSNSSLTKSYSFIAEIQEGSFRKVKKIPFTDSDFCGW